jgi:putative zinc-dependent peptidase DUF5700
MPRLGLHFAFLPATVLSLTATLAPAVRAQAAAARTRMLPAPGFDFSGVDQFWKLVDILSTDAEPTENPWRALLSAPGYRLAETNLGPVMRRDLELTFRPARHADFERLVADSSDHALRLAHLALAARERRALVALRDSLARGTPIADAVVRAARLLPPGATSHGSPPLVAFAVFADDAYSLPQGVVIDLLYAERVPLIAILAHEFHHTYVNRLNRPVPPGPPAPDAALRDALYNARNEGIADQIDKPYPFVSPIPAMASYVARYNAEYARTRQTLRQFDSLVSAIADDPRNMGDLGMSAQMLLWSNSHPNGAYIAREIIQTFGVDSLFPGIRDPAAFFRTYAAAERVHARPSPFSAKTWRVVDALEAKYWRAQ